MDKMKSRKLWVTIFWCSLIPLGFTYSIMTGQELSYMGQIITFAGTCTTAYVGIQGYADIKKEDY
jgi:hypothetical protein